MGENGLSIDQNPGRWLVLTAGAVFSEAGIQAMLTSQIVSWRVTTPVTAVGIVFILIAVFWNRLRLNQTAFFQRLNGMASHPGMWVGMVLIVWLSITTLQVLREIEVNNEIVGLRNDDQSIAKVIDRLVLPRRITERQKGCISDFLLQFDPHEYSFRLSSQAEEIGQYRADIEQVLTKGGWTRATNNPYVYDQNVQEGMRINFAQGTAHAQQQQGNGLKNPNAPLVLEEAFGLCRIPISGIGGSGGGDATEDRLTIEIGPARRDSYAFTTPDF
jgi:hypothetical protein